MPSYSIQFRRGTATDHSSFTGELAEITIDITNNRVVLHDGETPGGIPLAKVTDLPIDVGDLTDVNGNIAAAVAAMNPANWYGDRQIVFMGYAPYSYDNGPGYINNIEYFSFGTSATDFGDATVATAASAAFSDGSRAVRVAGYNTNVIDYISTATGGPATDFGNHLNNYSAHMQGISDGTYGVYAAGSNYYYVTIQNPSAWASNFGTAAISSHLAGSGGGGDGTYGIFTGGDDETIEKVTISTTGSATSHGDLVGPVTYPYIMSDNTYTVMARGNFNTDPYLEYITTATGGTAASFGSPVTLQGLYYGNQFAGASSDGTYGYVHGGSNSPSKIQYITFTSPSNQATAMGDLGQTVNQHTGTSGSPS